jgi:hypothetical protein
MSALGHKRTFLDVRFPLNDVRFTPESGHSIAADLMAMRAAAFELQQADELARSFAKSNTKRLIGSTDLSRSPDTSRSSP